MTTPPLPDVSCVRCHMIYNQGLAAESGNRFFLSYSGSAPSGPNCGTLATDIAAAWSSHLAPIISGAFALTEVDVLDITTNSGASGSWTGSNAGTRSGTAVSAQQATSVKFNISRRYRGGKSRIYLPGPVQTDTASVVSWSSSFVGAASTAWAAFMAAVVGASVGGMGTLIHITLSYYSMFTNVENTSGRMRAAPKYKSVATHDNVASYTVDATMGSQRRRRTSTSP